MKNKKFVIISLIILFVIFIIGLKIFIELNKEKQSIDDFKNIKEIVEYDGHTYIKEEKSTEEDFKKDIYITFSEPPINNNGITNKNLYEILIKHIIAKLSGENFRIIDKKNNVIIRIKFDKNEANYYTINNDDNYWTHLETQYQINNYGQDNILNDNFESEIINNLINQNWIAKNVNFGTKESSIGQYDVYYDEGYKVRIINSKVYNIIFTTNYKDNIVNKVGVNTNLEQIKQQLGAPFYENKEYNYICYKTNNAYVFFEENEVSVYPVEKVDQEKNSKFASIVTELNKTGDINTFINKLTDIYPDYETNYSSKKYVNIIYPLKGFEIIIGAKENNGITIYNNYNGKISEEISKEDIINKKIIPANVYTKFDEDLVVKTEEKRIYNDNLLRNPYIDDYTLKTNEYIVYKALEDINFYSINKSSIDSRLKVKANKIIEKDSSNFIYSIENKGIYQYNAKNCEIKEIISGNEKFNLIKYENGKLFYDDKSIQI